MATKQRIESMAVLRKAEFEALMAVSGTPCVSLYMPTHRKGREISQDPIRFKNLVKEAEKQLGRMEGAKADTLLAPLRPLMNDHGFWEHQSDGLAVFLSKDHRRIFRLPLDFEELVVVSDRFHLKRLLPMLSGDGRFFILTLSQGNVRLLEATRYHVSELDQHALPENIAAALWVDDEDEPAHQHHGSASPGAGQGTIFHGHGGAEDREKIDVERFFRRIDWGLTELLSEENAPLVLAGVDYYFPIFQRVTKYGNVMERGITGNPDEMDVEALHAKGWEVVAPLFEQRQKAAVAEYNRLAGTGKTSRQVEEIVPAAHHGRVDTLFVTLGKRCWGRFDGEPNGGVEVRRDDETRAGDLDLLDLAAAQTLQNGGTVYAMDEGEIPSKSSPVAAILRY